VTQATETQRYPEWSEADLNSYRAGTVVTHRGKTYRAKPWPADVWARQSYYEPGGGGAVWTYAWEELQAARGAGAEQPGPRRAHAGLPAPD
jgi:hypothetical protein